MITKEALGILGWLIAIFYLISSMYNSIRYACLKKAAEKVAEVEELKDLTGEQKFSLVVYWIDEELPKVFRNQLIIRIIEKLVQHAYNNSKNYADNYIKRKTGLDIGTILKNIANTNTSVDNNMKSGASTDN